LDAFNFLFLLEHGARERESIYSKARFLGWCQNKKKKPNTGGKRNSEKIRKLKDNPNVEDQAAVNFIKWSRGGNSAKKLKRRKQYAAVPKQGN